jgi:aerobic-type carbon monoxide dehydrogenase small subunit (CoxS/CutS family)
MKTSIPFRLNGRPTTLHTDDDRTLLWVLRTDLGLTGTKYGCGAGVCGACTVMIAGKAVRSCQTLLREIRNQDVVTIEGLAGKDGLHPLQEAFIEHGGFQCGYCTSGMIMNACALLRAQPRPSREAIVEGMEGNLCRCGAYQRIVAAIESASGKIPARGTGGAP